MRAAMLFAGAVLATPLVVFAQGATQSRDGLATASQGNGAVNNSAPAGSINATTGPQSRPAYPSGSTTPNPGAAFVQARPKPASGAAAAAPGIMNTTTVTGSGPTQQARSPGIGQAATPPK